MTPPTESSNPGSTRRARKPSSARKDDVLVAARRLFAERGYYATSTRDLAIAADINDALLYRYFPNKDAILTALVDEAISAFQVLPVVPPEIDLPTADLLEIAGKAFVQIATEQLDLLTILISEHYALAHDHRFVEFIHRAATNFGRILEERAGIGTNTSGYLTARSYMGSLIAFVILQNVLGLNAVEPIDPTDYIHHLATLTARGLSESGQTGNGKVRE